MKFRILLEDLFVNGNIPEVGEQVFQNHLSIVAEAGFPYIEQKELPVGCFKSTIFNKPHLFQTYNGIIHTKNCYIKREIEL